MMDAADARDKLQLAMARRMGIAAVEKMPTIGKTWVALGIVLGHNEKITIHKKVYSQIELFVEGLTRDPKYASGWVELANALRLGSWDMHPSAPSPDPSSQPFVTIKGRRFTVQQMLVEALKYDAKKAETWALLSTTLPKPLEAGSPAPTATVNGRQYTRLQCLMASLKYDPTMTNSWSAVADMEEYPGVEWPVTINGAAYTPHACRLRAAALEFVPRAGTWSSLAGSMETIGESTVDINGKSYSRLDCAVRALELEPTGMRWHGVGMYPLVLQQEQARAGMNIDKEASALFHVTIKGVAYTPIECFLEGLKLDPTFSGAWYALGIHLMGANTVITGTASGGAPVPACSSSSFCSCTSLTVSGRAYTAVDCFIKALEHFHSRDNLSALLVPEGQIWRQAGIALRKAGDCDGEGDGERQRVMCAMGKSYTALDCLVRAVTLRPSDGVSWLELCYCLNDGAIYGGHPCGGGSHSSPVIDGRSYSAAECFVEALLAEINPQPSAWGHLGAHMRAVGLTSITARGATYTRQECHVQTIREYDRPHKVENAGPFVARAWLYLGETLLDGETVASPHGADVDAREYTDVACFLEALRIDPGLVDAWYALGEFLGASSSSSSSSSPSPPVVSVGGVPFDEQQCYVRAIEVHADKQQAVSARRVASSGDVHVRCWCALGNALGAQAAAANANAAIESSGGVDAVTPSLRPPPPVATVLGTAYTSQQCYLQALASDPCSALAWRLAGNSIHSAAHADDASSSVVVVDGTPYTRAECVVKADHADLQARGLLKGGADALADMMDELE